jgi:predicted alpha/beta hydrolase family esterase
VRRAAEALQGPVLLVGHSYGGAVITEAAHLCPNVSGLVYIAGFAPDKGESLSILSSSGPVVPPGAAAIRPDRYGFLWIDRELFPENFCQDLDQVEASVMAATQKPLSVASFEGKVTDAGWKNLPCWYQISINDRMIPPQAEQFMAQRIKAKTISVASSHASMVSRPKEIGKFILGAAEEVMESVAGNSYHSPIIVGLMKIFFNEFALRVACQKKTDLIRRLAKIVFDKRIVQPERHTIQWYGVYSQIAAVSGMIGHDFLFLEPGY